MASVKLWRDEVEDGDLPDVCVCCGEPSTTAVNRTFSWHPQWVLVLLLAGLLPFLIVALILTKRMRMAVPFCDTHKRHWTKRAVFTWGGLALLVVLAIGAFVILEENRPRGNDPLGGYLCGGVVVLGLVWLFAAAIVQTTAIRPSEITDDSITLLKVHKEFVAARRNLRAGYKVDTGEDDRPRRRPNRDDDRDPPRRRRRRDDDEYDVD